MIRGVFFVGADDEFFFVADSIWTVVRQIVKLGRYSDPLCEFTGEGAVLIDCDEAKRFAQRLLVRLRDLATGPPFSEFVAKRRAELTDLANFLCLEGPFTMQAGDFAEPQSNIPVPSLN